MILKDLLQLTFNAGRENPHDPALGWEWWWREYGAERHDDFVKGFFPGSSLPGDEGVTEGESEEG